MLNPVEDFMVGVQEALTRQGFPELDLGTLTELAGRLRDPEVQRNMASGHLTPDSIVREVKTALLGRITPTKVASHRDEMFGNDAMARTLATRNRVRYATTGQTLTVQEVDEFLKAKPGAPPAAMGGTIPGPAAGGIPPSPMGIPGVGA